MFYFRVTKTLQKIFFSSSKCFPVKVPGIKSIVNFTGNNYFKYYVSKCFACSIAVSATLKKKFN